MAPNPPVPGAEHILHVDMDAFYASVEIRRDPVLRHKPVIVGGLGNRGVVLAASYEARRFGVRSGMPSATARRACPNAVWIPPDFAAYSATSRVIRSILEEITPLVEPISLDEAFLDVAGVRRLHGDAVQIGHRIRAAIRDRTGLPASVGVAASKFVAKMASRAAKPDGLLCVRAGTETLFLHPLPVAELWGVGAATRNRLATIGVRTIGDLAAVPLEKLQRCVGSATGCRLHDLAHGRDDRPVVVDRAPKSIGNERTFDVDITDDSGVRAELRCLSERVAGRLRSQGVAARTITLKCRLAPYRTLTRTETLPAPIDSGPAVYETACRLYDRLRLPTPRVRLLGVSASRFETPAPLSQHSAWQKVMLAADAVRDRFGEAAFVPAAYLARDVPLAQPDADIGGDSR
jgi:DNA polymerase-4